MSRTTEIVTHGWLTKSPPARGLFRPRWRRRWFILRTGSFPNQFVLEYFTDESCRRQKGQINLDECEQLDLSSNPQIAAPLSVQDRHKFTFNLRTPSRVYYLAADTEAEMNKWVTCLCQVCGLKTVEETEMYTKSVDENNQPESTENRESDESSPSLSNHLSGPYIPISECFTGKPIRFNEKQETTYCNTSFPFPPKVNWATHPAKREGSDSESVGIPGGKASATAPPRPPKKSSSSLTTAMNSPQGCNENMKTLSLPSSSRSVFPYDNFEETHDSSSTCSSLHSPPGSAGVLYSNISEISPAFHSPATFGNPAPQSHLNPIPSPGDPHVPPVPSPPKVDRNLKPDLRKPVESPSYKSHQQKSPTHKYASKHTSGAMTLPSTKSQRQTVNQTPAADRRPNDSPITLGPTPVQKKIQTADYTNPRFASTKSSTNTLPSSPRRRVGPALSPHDKKPVFHEYETARELTYLQIDCKSSDGDTKSSKISLHKRSQSASHSEDPGAVEYRLIDHIKTQALNQMLLDREEQLRTNVSKNLK